MAGGHDLLGNLYAVGEMISWKSTITYQCCSEYQGSAVTPIAQRCEILAAKPFTSVGMKPAVFGGANHPPPPPVKGSR